MLVALEDAVRHVYGDFSEAVEPIVAEKELRERFLDKVRHLQPDACEKDIFLTLFALRKRGQAKGGLPRKSRSLTL